MKKAQDLLNIVGKKKTMYEGTGGKVVKLKVNQFIKKLFPFMKVSVYFRDGINSITKEPKLDIFVVTDDFSLFSDSIIRRVQDWVNHGMGMIALSDGSFGLPKGKGKVIITFDSPVMLGYEREILQKTGKI